MRPAARRRPASVALAALIACTFLFVLFGLFIWIGVVRAAKTEARRASNAAAIAAALRLADNAVLTEPSPTSPGTILFQAASAAQSAAAPNLIYGRPPTVAPFVNNVPTGDIVFGTVNPALPVGQRFTAGPNPVTTTAQLAAINAVLVRANGIVGGCPNDDGTVCGGRPIGPGSVAWFDTAVYGFRPVNLPNPPTANDPRTPIVPIALFQENTPVAGTPSSWSELGTIPVGGPVPTVTVILGPTALFDGLAVQGAALSIGGTTAFPFYTGQLGTGVSGAHLTGPLYNGRFELPNPLPSAMKVPAATNPPTVNPADYAPLIGRTVVFPLYSALLPDPGGVTGETALVTGFVSARVTAVALTPVIGQVQLTLVPMRFQTPSALTDPARYNPDTRPYQPIVGRVRLAE